MREYGAEIKREEAKHTQNALICSSDHVVTARPTSAFDGNLG